MRSIEPGSYHLRFTPGPLGAERTIDVEKILGGDIEFDVELR